MKDFLKWFEEEENLRNLRTGSTFFFIGFMILYFYGFRSGFIITLNDVWHMIADILLMLISSFLVMSDYTQRGIASALADSDVKEPHLQRAINRHNEQLEKIEPDTLSSGINKWNEKEKKKAVEERKKELVEKYKEKKRQWYTKKDTGKKHRKLKKFDKKIAYFSDPETTVKAKYKHVTQKKLKKKSAYKDRGISVDFNYDPYQDTMMSQSGVVVLMLFITTLLRFAVDPSMEQVGETLRFLGILIPFLIIRALFSYQIAQENTKNKYPEALHERADIIEWCMKKGDKNEMKIGWEGTEETHQKREP